MSLFNLFEDPLKKLKKTVEEINSFERKFENFSQEDFKKQTQEFQKQIEQGKTLDDVLPEAFALVREAAKRTIGQRHFDVQLLGGIVLHQGKIAEMKTGEGKTLTATLSVYLNALEKKGVHIVTVNDYLSKRDALWMGPIYHLFGLSVGCLQHEQAFKFENELRTMNHESRTNFSPETDSCLSSGTAPSTENNQKEKNLQLTTYNLQSIPRKEAYECDILYGTNNEFGFDYLRDNLAHDFDSQVQRPLNFAIIDEVDSILIDEARTPLIISSPNAEPTEKYYHFAKIIPQLKEGADYNIDEKMKAATLTEEGTEKIENILGIKNLYQEKVIDTIYHVEQALRAHTLFKKDRDYVVKNNEVIIVDEFTGRLMPGRRYSEGLHQALEAKEEVRIQKESQTLASISFQNYFRLYKKIAGMTGTALTSAEELSKVYNLEIAAIPTNKPMIRKNLPDVIFKTEKEKFKAIVKKIKELHQEKKPVLVGTISIEKNELLSDMLSRENISHQILNAKYHEKEAQIISQTGRLGAVTIATNMAGRGVDIELGGKKPSESEKLWAWQREHDEIVKLGGLTIIGTERHEARRIDNQLRGRTGRQGDPGCSQFFLSLQDDLMKVFGGEKLKSLMERLKFPDDQPIENGLISKAIEQAQSRVEGYNFDLRKHLLEYDDVMNKQREVIYKRRKEVLEIAKKNQSLKEKISEMIEKEIGNIVSIHARVDNQTQWDIEEILEQSSTIFPLEEEDKIYLRGIPNQREKFGVVQKRDEIIKFLEEKANVFYQKKEEEEKGENVRFLEKTLLLSSIDSLWIEHLEAIDHLREGIYLRAYGQKEPLIEYKREAYNLFAHLIEEIEKKVVYTFFKLKLVQAPVETSSFSREKINRNDPCPCGAKKPDGHFIKYKHCHGKNV